MRTNRVAVGIGEREGTEKIVDMKKESGEDYARKILEFLEAERERQGEKRRKKKMMELNGICSQKYSSQQERRRKQRRTRERKESDR